MYMVKSHKKYSLHFLTIHNNNFRNLRFITDIAYKTYQKTFIKTFLSS